MEKNPCANKIKGSSVQDNGRLQSSDNKAILWPSERIPQGGLFHCPKIEYSQETADLLKG